MRRKKQKHTRRTIRFFKINFGFRPPFKVLLDGNFVHTVEAQKRGECKELVSRLLGEPARVFTTKCVMQELRTMGKEYALARQACKRYALHHCNHDEGVSAADCLASQVEGGNAEHFFVATQDRGLQRRVGDLPGGAVLFASINGLQLDVPSDAQKQHVERAERIAQGGGGEASERRRQLAAKEGGESREDEEEDRQQREKSIFKRNKAKGPNPLAIRKKKRVGAAPAAAVQQPAAAREQEKAPKRQRRRRKDEGDLE